MKDPESPDETCGVIGFIVERTNPFAEVASVLYKDTARKTFTRDRDRDAQRLADTTAAAGFLRKEEGELDALRSQLNAVQVKLAAPRAQTVYWPNVQYPVYSVAYVMPRNKHVLDQTMGCIVFNSLPAYGKYDAVMTDGSVLYRCMVDTHNRNLDERVHENQMVTSREDYRYVGAMFSCTGPLTLLGMFYISIIRRSGLSSSEGKAPPLQRSKRRPFHRTSGTLCELDCAAWVSLGRDLIF